MLPKFYRIKRNFLHELVDPDGFSNALFKTTRPYAEVIGTIIDGKQLTYFVPLRSELPAKQLENCPESVFLLPYGKKQFAGFDFNKIIVVTNENKQNFTKISGYLLPRKQAEALNKNYYDFIARVNYFVVSYIEYTKEEGLFKSSALKYFHKELGLPNK